MIYHETIPYDRIDRIKPVIAQKIGNRYESMAEVKKRTQCTHIINGGTYNSARELDSGLKIDNTVLKSGAFGFGIIESEKIVWSYGGTWCKDWFGAFGDIVRNGVHQPVLNDKAKRGRTGVGISDKGVTLAVVQDKKKGACTSTDFMQTYFKDCTHAINLDGGGSSQCNTPHIKIVSGRPVVWYLCLWVKPDDGVKCKVVNVRTWLTVRSKPSLSCYTLGKLYTGNHITVLEWLGTYAKIDYYGDTAYVTAKYLRRL